MDKKSIGNLDEDDDCTGSDVEDDIDMVTRDDELLEHTDGASLTEIRDDGSDVESLEGWGIMVIENNIKEEETSTDNSVEDSDEDMEIEAEERTLGTRIWRSSQRRLRNMKTWRSRQRRLLWMKTV